jgi:hypothetical protein
MYFSEYSTVRNNTFHSAGCTTDCSKECMWFYVMDMTELYICHSEVIDIVRLPDRDGVLFDL